MTDTTFWFIMGFIGGVGCGGIGVCLLIAVFEWLNDNTRRSRGDKS